MGLLNSALHIGRSAILGYQGALQIVGDNISNVGNPDHTRLTPELESLQGASIAEGVQPGAGVALSGLRRNINEALEGRLRLAIGQVESLQAQQSTLTQLETLFADDDGLGLGSQLITFLNGFDDLQNSPEDPAARDLVLANGSRLAQDIQSVRSRIGRLADDADAQIADLVEQADALAARIADFNHRITIAEAGGAGEATALRDERDASLRELSTLFDVTARLQRDGTLNIYVGSETLVQGERSRGLIAVRETGRSSTRTTVRFADSNTELDVRGGLLGGLIISRDQYGQEQIDALDELAQALIFEVNRLHADGQGLVGYRSVVSAGTVLDPEAVLNSTEAGLSRAPQNGSFFITVIDEATSTPVAYRIDVDLDGIDTDTSLATLVAAINDQVSGVTAEVTVDNRLSLTAEDGYSFTFGHDGQQTREDTSNVLAALGVNTFFTGNDASNVAVNEALVDDPLLVAASSVFLSGDGGTARRIAELDNAKLAALGGITLHEFYESIVNGVAVATSAINESVESSRAVLGSFQAQKEGISGVSLDEEAIEMVKFERSFQGASRFINVVDTMIQELLAIVR
jgi:flagellar hook-associated protein 1 FlgK